MRARDVRREYRLIHCHSLITWKEVFPEIANPTATFKREVAKLGEAIAKIQECKNFQGSGRYDRFRNANTRAKEVAKLNAEFLKPLRQAARSISRKMPGLVDSFQMAHPRSSLDTILKNAKTALRAAKKHRALFMDYEMPADFVQSMQKQIELVEKSGKAVPVARKNMREGSTGALYWLREGEEILRHLNVIVGNRCRTYYAEHGKNSILPMRWESEYRHKKERAARKVRQLVPVIP